MTRMRNWITGGWMVVSSVATWEWTKWWCPTWCVIFILILIASLERPKVDSQRHICIQPTTTTTADSSRNWGRAGVTHTEILLAKWKLPALICFLHFYYYFGALFARFVIVGRSSMFTRLAGWTYLERKKQQPQSSAQVFIGADEEGVDNIITAAPHNSSDRWIVQFNQ